MLSKNQQRDIRALHLKKHREAQKRFIAEGAKTVGDILAQHPGIIESIFATENFITQHLKRIREAGVGHYQVSDDELRSISLQTNPNHVLAVCRQPHVAAQPKKPSRFSFYLDDIRDPGNFGTILRICDWFGARNLYCSPACCELYNPKVIQASMGAFLRVHVNYLSLDEALRITGYTKIYGAVLDGADLFKERLADGLILIGNEANGISPEHRGIVNRPVTIPAQEGNGSESLNAAMATAIIASEFFRQIRK